MLHSLLLRFKMLLQRDLTWAWEIGQNRQATKAYWIELGTCFTHSNAAGASMLCHWLPTWEVYSLNNCNATQK